MAAFVAGACYVARCRGDKTLASKIHNDDATRGRLSRRARRRLRQFGRKRATDAHASRLLVNPRLVAALVRGDALGEPEADLVLRGLDGVGAVDHVAAELDAEVTADGAGLGGAVGGRRVEGKASVSGGSRRAIEKAYWRRSAIEIKGGRNKTRPRVVPGRTEGWWRR